MLLKQVNVVLGVIVLKKAEPAVVAAAAERRPGVAEAVGRHPTPAIVLNATRPTDVRSSRLDSQQWLIVWATALSQTVYDRDGLISCA